MGGIPRANETLSKSVVVPESWTNLLLWAPESRSEWYANSGNQYIKTWYQNDDNYVELYFNPDSMFVLEATVDGITETPIRTTVYKFYGNSVIRLAIRCDESFLGLSVSAAAPFEHRYGAAIDFLRSTVLTSKTGNHNGTGLMSCTILSDKLYEGVIADDILE